MHWADEGIVISAKPHGEAHAVAEMMTREHGRHVGLVRGGHGRKMRPLLQPGNSLAVVWRGRLESHLGTFTVELTHARAALWLHSAAPLQGMAVLSAHLHLLAEREPHPELYEALTVLLDALDHPHLAGALLIRFELALLQTLGFGLDLASCAATGASEDLTHVSPRSGRAVARAAAIPYKERLLRLPSFLLKGTLSAEPALQDIADGARLTGYFFGHHVYEPRGLEAPAARDAFFKTVSVA